MFLCTQQILLVTQVIILSHYKYIVLSSLCFSAMHVRLTVDRRGVDISDRFKKKSLNIEYYIKMLSLVAN